MSTLPLNTPSWLQASAIPAMPQVPQLSLPAQAPKRKGMFAGTTIDLNGALAGFLAGMGNPAGQQALANLHQRKMMEQRQAQEEQQYQRQRMDGREDYLWKQQHDTTPPTEFERMAAAAGIQPGSPEFQGLARQYVQNKANPFMQMRVQNPDGSETLQLMRPPAALPETLTDDDWGGPTQPASGNFL